MLMHTHCQTQLMPEVVLEQKQVLSRGCVPRSQHWGITHPPCLHPQGIAGEQGGGSQGVAKLCGKLPNYCTK